MKKLLLASLFLLPLQANAADWRPAGFYASIGGGWTKVQDSDFDDGAGDTGHFTFNGTGNFAGALGLKITPNIRSEIEVGYRKADIDQIHVNGVGSASVSGDVATTTYMLNGYYDFMPEQKFSPFLTAGIGAAHRKGQMDAIGSVSFPAVSSSDTVFAYQLGAGVTYHALKDIDVWGGYRYLGTSKPDFDGLKADYGAHEIRAGLTFNF